MFINSLDDFYIHTKNHIDNVNLLAEQLMEMVRRSPMLKKYYNIPEDADFDEVKKVVLDGIKLHDQAKINLNEDFLKKYNLEKPMYKQLYARYGKGRSEKEWAITKPIIDKLNKIDEEIMDNYASQYEDWLKELILGVESISDKVERGQNPITPEEMGQPPLIASKFLEGKINEYEMAMVKVLEERYYEFCEYKINKKVISKEKYWDFIIENNLEKYVIEDDLSFKIKKDVLSKIVWKEDEISKEHSYNSVFFDIISSNLIESLSAIKNLQYKVSVVKEETYENYQLVIKNTNSGENLYFDSLISFKDKDVFEEVFKEDDFMKFIYDKKSPVFSQKHYNNYINYQALLNLKKSVEELSSDKSVLDELNNFIS